MKERSPSLRHHGADHSLSRGRRVPQGEMGGRPHLQQLQQHDSPHHRPHRRRDDLILFRRQARKGRQVRGVAIRCDALCLGGLGRREGQGDHGRPHQGESGRRAQARGPRPGAQAAIRAIAQVRFQDRADRGRHPHPARHYAEEGRKTRAQGVIVVVDQRSEQKNRRKGRRAPSIHRPPARRGACRALGLSRWCLSVASSSATVFPS